MGKRQQILSDAVDAVAAAYTDLHEDASFYPAEAFEQATGLKKISAHYDLPEGATPESWQASIIGLHDRCMGAGILLRQIKQNGGIDDGALAKREKVLKPELESLEAKKSKRDAKDKPMSESLAEAYYTTRQELAEVQGLRAVHAAYGEKAQAKLEQFLETVEAARHTVIREMFDAVIQLNPKLAALDVDRSDTSQMDDVVQGAISHFNVADIQFFSIDQMSYGDAMQNPKWAKQYDAIERRTGEPIGWVPAPSTLDHITRQLDKREEKSKAR